jgi:peptidyl-prolyl cis-trans isomerase D
MRRALSSWLILGLLGLIMIAFIITGFGTGGGGLGELGGGPARLASVGDQVITEQDVTSRLNRMLKAAQRDQPTIDMATIIKLGAFEAAVDQAIMDKAQAAFASEMGIGASKRMVDGEIASEPSFLNAAGQFDENGFRAALREAGMNEAEFRQNVLVDLLRRQLLLPIAQGAQMPAALLNHYASMFLETRTGVVGVIPTQAVGPGSDPTEPEIAAYFASHKARYTIPERRVLRYAPFGWNDVVGTVKATDAEIEAAYKAAGAKYGPKETRAVAQLTLPDQAAANALVAKVKAGKSFDAAAGEAGFAPTDIVRVEGVRNEVAGKVVPEIANAAFAASQGAIVGPVRSPLGWHVARVEKVTVSAARPLAAVRDELATAVQQRKAAELLNDRLTKIEDEVSDGASFDEVVSAFKLNVVETQPVTATGEAPGTNYQLPAEAKPLVKSAFELEADSDPQLETIAQGQSYALLAVRQVVDPTVPPLAQVRDRIKADMIAERSADRAKKLSDQLVAKIGGGTPMREAFAAAGVALPPLQPVSMRRIDAIRAGERLPPPVQLMFSLPRGKPRSGALPNGQGWYISFVETVAPGDPKLVQPLAQELKTQFSTGLGEEYAEQFIRSLEKQVGVKRNAGAIARLKQRLLSGS